MIGEKGDWYQLGTDRWIQKSVTQLLGVQTGKVSGAPDLNVRLGPGTDYDVSHKLALGAQVQLFGEQDNWYRIGHREWVSSKFIQVI